MTYTITNTSVRPTTTVPFFSKTVVPAVAASVTALETAAHAAAAAGNILSTSVTWSGNKLTHAVAIAFKDEPTYTAYAAANAAAIADVGTHRDAYNLAVGIIHTETQVTA